MAISYVAASARTTANVTAVATSSRAITLPTGTTSGDIVLLIVMTLDDTSIASAKSTLTVPSQWTPLYTGTFTAALSDTYYVDYRVYWARVPVTAGSMSWKSGDYSTIIYHTVAYRGATTANPPFESVAVNNVSGDASVSTVNASVPAISVSNDGASALVLNFAVADGSGTLSLAAASGWTRRTTFNATSTGSYLQSAFDLAVTTASTTAAVRFPFSGNNGRIQGRFVTAAFIPAGAVTTPTKGTINVNVGGTWKSAQSLWVNSAGTWKQAQSAWVNSGGTWKQVL